MFLLRLEASSPFIQQYWAPICAWVVAQSCAPLCDPLDCSPPGSSVQGISQARLLEWVAIFLLQPSDWIPVSCVSCIADWVFTYWATGEAPEHQYLPSPISGVGKIAMPCPEQYPSACRTFFFFFFLFGHGTWHVESFLTRDQSPLLWEHGVLTTGPPGKSTELVVLRFLNYFSLGRLQ